MAGLRSAFVIWAALLLSGSVAVAQQGNPCDADIKKLCAGIQPGAGRLHGVPQTSVGQPVGKL